MSFSLEIEKENNYLFLSLKLYSKRGKFTTTTCLKSAFSGIYSNYETFLPLVYKFCMGILQKND